MVFLGASHFGFKCCETILKEGFDVVGVLTSPQEFRIPHSKGRPVINVLHADFRSVSERYGVPLMEMAGAMKDLEVVDKIRSWAPNLIMAVGWYHMVPWAIRNIPELGSMGMHASLLPRYAGGAPLVWALINGEKETGITLFHFDKGVDTGDIVLQRKVTIDFEDTIGTLYGKVEEEGLSLLKDALPRIADGSAPRIPQDLSHRTVFPMRTPEDGLIDWGWPASRIYNFVRAQTKPYPGAFTTAGDKRLIVWEAGIGPVASGRPGKILERVSGKGVLVSCGKGTSIFLKTVQPDGAQSLDASLFAETEGLSKGEAFGTVASNTLRE